MTDPRLAPGGVLEEVPVFPLPQVVLFPGALMPLHIFEPRYRAMTRDAIAADRLLSVALIADPKQRLADGRPVFASTSGLGRIVRHDALPDGRFNILVEGLCRVHLEELSFQPPYRRARARVLAERSAAEGPEVSALSSLALRFASQVQRSHPGFRFQLPKPQSPGRLADTCAHYLVLDGAERQRLLETLDDAERVQRCLDALLSQQDEPPSGQLLH